MNHKELKDFLDLKVEQYYNSNFILEDPISIPHKFKLREDIEISAFLTATLSWGNRKAIIKSTNYLMQLLDNDPYNFIINSSSSDLSNLDKFVYRTFQNIDFVFFILALKEIYSEFENLENLFYKGYAENNSVKESIVFARKVFMQTRHEKRSEKHFSNPAKGSSSKRLNMFLRWMVRKNNKGVDFGIWSKFSTSNLMLPLDVHTFRVGRRLGLLNRNITDWKAVEEITENLKKFNNSDPIIYDYALFGLGVYEKF